MPVFTYVKRVGKERVYALPIFVGFHLAFVFRGDGGVGVVWVVVVSGC